MVEATCGWMWLADLLDSVELQVHLAHMKGVRVIAESRCKTDRIDARVLADLLRTNFLPEAYSPRWRTLPAPLASGPAGHASGQGHVFLRREPGLVAFGAGPERLG